MKLSQIKRLLHCTHVSGPQQDERSFHRAFCSDLMSDVLAYIHDDDTLLLTGLCNTQVIRTAEMIDLKVIVFIRDKRPTREMVQMAMEQKILLLTTTASMFHAAGILYQHGMRGVSL